MRVSLFWRLGATYLALVLAVVLCVDWLALRFLRLNALQSGTEQLDSLKRYAQARAPSSNDAEALRSWLAELSAGGARVAVIAPDGRVLLESRTDAETSESLSAMPEVRDAFSSAAGEGRAVRHSATLDRDFIYSAVRRQTPTGPVVLDFSLPLASIELSIIELRRQLWFGSAAIFLFALAISIILSNWFAKRVQRLKGLAERAAAGDFSPPERDSGRDELTEIADALGGTVAQLGQTIRTLTDERNLSAAILGSMVEGVAVVAGDERILYCNQAFDKILEVPMGTSRGKKLLEALRQADMVAAVRQVLPGGEEVTGEVEVGTIRPRCFSITAAPVKAAGASGAVLVLHEITELRRLERVRRDFVANVSHEFKTPLTAIQGFAETLLNGALDDKANRKRFIEIIREHAKRLARLTDDLLKLSRIEAGQLELESQPVSVASLVNACVETARLKAGPKGLQIKVELPIGIPPVRGDGSQLGEVLQNLLDNAVQYTPAGGVIDVKAQSNGKEVTFTVSDTGIGIPESDLERVFERFYRVDAARSREVGGTGLGLSIARHIVDAHGGRIWVESAVGLGSRFHFSIASAQ